MKKCLIKSFQKFRDMFCLNLLFIWLFATNTIATRCDDFHEGFFVYGESKYKGVVIHRGSDEQVEQIGDTLTVSFFIRWVDDCNYILVPKKVLYKSKENDLPKDTIRVSITEILSDTSYRYTAIVKGVETDYTMIKLKQAIRK